MKSITFVAAGLLGGGIERAFSSLANHLAESGYDISVILLFQSEHFFKLDERIKLLEPKIDRSNHNKYIYAVKTIPYLRSGIRAFAPDVILSYGEWFNPFVILSTRGMGIPLFISDRMSPALKLGFVQDTAKKLLYRFADGIMAQTTHAKEIISKRTSNSNIRVIPNPVNAIDRIDVVPRDQIVSVGRLSREKGHDILIEAFAKIKHDNWSLHLVGDGKEMDRLKSLTTRLNITDSVCFHGHLKDFREVLSRSKIFVLPSWSEGFPNALIEAMSIPLACISSDCVAGPADIIQEGVNGFLFPPGDREALTKKLDLLIEKPEMRKRISEEAYKIRSQLEFSKIADKILSFIGCK